MLLGLYIYIYIYIYIVIHRQICFVLTEIISVARQARFPKLGSKPGWLKRQSKILPLSHEETRASEGNLNGYESQWLLLIYPLNGYRELDLYIYIYIYISVATLAYFPTGAPPPSVNFSSQSVVRGPKVSHHSCYCVILHCIAQIDKRTLHGVFFCKQSRYYIICSLVNTVDNFFFLSKG